MDLRFALLLVCFFVSGFAALLYQTAWTREFAFLFGTSELAVVAVLAAYMAGLALGAAAAARFVRRLTRPVWTYGVLELGIGLFALAVPLGIRAVRALYLSLAGGLDAPPETLALTTALFHLFGAFCVLVPCTALMGATLPLLARYAVHEDAQVGPRVGVLYAVNTFGAIAGTLVAAFLLLPELGLRRTVHVGIAGNVVVFLAAAALARGLSAQPHRESAGEAERRRHWILPAMLVSGAISFVYEVLWTRLLGQVLGGSTAAFASMLSSFLLGIALGSAVAARFARTREAAGRGFVIAQLGVGLLAFVAFRASDWLPELAGWVGASPSSPAPGAAAAGILLLPLTLCIGATFPFGVRLLARSADEAATTSGRVYAWNTVGSIVGATLAGFFLLPVLGLERTALAGVVTSLGLALFAATRIQPRPRKLGGLVIASLVLVVVLRLPTPERLLLYSAMTGARQAGEIHYLGIGRSATVTVVEHHDGWKLMTNGLPESGVDRPELPTLRFNETAWLSLLPTAVRPETRRMMIIGLGAGRTLQATAASVESIDVIELEEEVVVANHRIPRPVDPLEDPRVTLRLGDARGAMMLTDATYDAIVSQPSHPWTSGASHLYTREFFELSRSKLEPGGVFVQWIGASFVDEDLFASLMAAMTATFEHVHVYRPVPPALVFVASDEPIDMAESAPRALARTPEDFGRHGIHRIEDFYASWALDTAGLRRLSASAPENTDDHNRLATKRLPPSAVGPGADGRSPIVALFEREEVLDATTLAEVDPVAVARRLTWLGQRERVEPVLEDQPPAIRVAAAGWLLHDNGQMLRAHRRFEQALELDATLEAARDGLFATAPNDGVLETHAPNALQRALVEGRQAMIGASPTVARALDEILARARPGDLLYPDVARLRARWRLATDDPALAAEAQAIVDDLLSRQRRPSHYFLRAHAAARAGRSREAWATLEVVVSRPTAPPALRRRAVALARSLGEPPPHVPILTRLLNRSRAAG